MLWAPPKQGEPEATVVLGGGARHSYGEAIGTAVDGGLHRGSGVLGGMAPKMQQRRGGEALRRVYHY